MPTHVGGFKQEPWDEQKSKQILCWLVVWNMAFMTFHAVNVTIPTDELSMIFQRGRLNHQPGMI